MNRFNEKLQHTWLSFMFMKKLSRVRDDSHVSRSALFARPQLAPSGKKKSESWVTACRLKMNNMNKTDYMVGF